MRSLTCAVRFLILAALCGAPQLHGLESELDALADSRGYAAQRLRDRFASPIGELTFALTGASVRGVPTALLPAVVSPYLTAGPLRLEGLLHELADPVGHAPGTTLYKERSGVCLDGSLQPGQRRGVLFSPFPSHLDLFWLREEAGPTMLGALSFVRLPEEVDGTFFLLATLPPEGEPSAAWFSDAETLDPPYVFHAGGSLSAGGRLLETTIAGALSLSPVEPPGGWLRATIGHASPSFHLSATAVGATPSALLPDGRFPDRVASAGFAAELLLPFGSAAGSYHAFLLRLPLLPVSYRENGQQAEVDLTVGESPVRLVFGYEQERSATRVGRVIVDEELSGRLVCDFPWTRFALSSAWSWSNLYDPEQSVEAAWKVGPSARAEGPSLELAIGCRLPGGRIARSPVLVLPEEGWSSLAGAAGVAGRGLRAAELKEERSGESREEGASPTQGASTLPLTARRAQEPSLTGRVSARVPFRQGSLSLQVALANPVRLSVVDELIERPLKRLIVTATLHLDGESGARQKEAPPDRSGSP